MRAYNHLFFLYILLFSHHLLALPECVPKTFLFLVSFVVYLLLAYRLLLGERPYIYLYVIYMYVCVCVCVYIYIYIYIHVCVYEYRLLVGQQPYVLRSVRGAYNIFFVLFYFFCGLLTGCY